MYYQTQQAKPTAYVTVGRQRLKQNGDTVYLNDGNEFEVEMFNPTTKPILAKLKINGTYIGGGGVVIKPGQRIFLERYLDQARKFKFETYTVEGKSSEVREAIANNGIVEVEFYDEKLKTVNLPYIQHIWFPHTSGGSFGQPIGHNYYNSTLTNTNISYGTTTASETYGNITADNLSFTNSVSEKSLDFEKPRTRSMSKKLSKSIETGRVEKGSHSSQEFMTVNMDFEYYSSTKVLWKLLPVSQKMYTSDEIKRFCPSCGTKMKKSSWKFCPNCGEEV
jgi:hypothetical protein